jgi:peroxiredoxin (alkyl hydroperoxide reductase subunit C)
MDEVLRVVDALQTADEKGVATPANWKPGEDCIMPPPRTQQDAEKRVADKSLKVTDWYYSKKPV